ncbi:hypothetical protein ASF40_03865 [Microbacterium sp. Leaf288]|uniref:hypothetical protein n=1 Tax=Microbacterium sp. Leaf288 TaxID=1736323 RepID=UPI0006FC8A5E|nr:hypothetical protein [Microbacterium sp. Leaf288]KQP70972.1 hypothetical protein ASF40_03865 [Microbacterium sp. Leaf288]
MGGAGSRKPKPGVVGECARAALAVTMVLLLSGCAADGADSGPQPTAVPSSQPTTGGGDEGDGEGEPGSEPSAEPTEGGGQVEPGLPTAGPTPEPGAPPGPDEAVARFQERCEEGVEEWREGKVDYPSELSVPVEGAVNYNAALDVRSEPLPADEVVDVGDGAAASEEVLVKCTVAARLTPVGDALSVAEEPTESVGGWIVQEFSPKGVVEWSWTVTALEPVDQQLRLELRPAIVVEDAAGDPGYASRNLASFTTDVTVEASLLHRTAYWFEVNWPLIVIIATAIGAGSLAVVTWWRKIRPRRKAGVRTTDGRAT